MCATGERKQTRGYRSRVYGDYVRVNLATSTRTAQQVFSAREGFLRRVIQRHFPPDRKSKILDLGCGNGAVVHFLFEAGYADVIGVDDSPEQIRQAESLGIRGVRRGDLIDTLQQTPDGTVDAVATFNVMEHLTKDEAMSVADGIYRVLARGGRWIIHAPNGESPFVGRVLYGDLTHENAFTRNSMTQLLKCAGFRVVSCYEDPVACGGTRGVVRWAMWKMVRAALRVWVAAETGSTDSHAVYTQTFLTVGVK